MVLLSSAASVAQLVEHRFGVFGVMGLSTCGSMVSVSDLTHVHVLVWVSDLVLQRKACHPSSCRYSPVLSHTSDCELE